jgi:hypothetical protein
MTFGAFITLSSHNAGGFSGKLYPSKKTLDGQREHCKPNNT